MIFNQLLHHNFSAFFFTLRIYNLVYTDESLLSCDGILSFLYLEKLNMVEKKYSSLAAVHLVVCVMEKLAAVGWNPQQQNKNKSTLFIVKEQRSILVRLASQFVYLYTVTLYIFYSCIKHTLLYFRPVKFYNF